jgi:kynurenine formamidase
MRRTLTATAILIAAMIGGDSASLRSQGSTEPPPRNLDEFERIFNELSNWGRWGRDDQLGKGCGKLGIEALKAGVITRGILIDIPRLRGVPYLDPGTAVYTRDIEAWEKKSGVRVTSGDAVLLYTGRWARRAAMGPWRLPGPVAGFHVSIGRWLKERDVAIVGSDAATDVTPARFDGLFEPLHHLIFAGLGAPILDALDLEAVAQTAAKLGRWEFMLSVAPIPVTGGTGGPVNVLATF